MNEQDTELMVRYIAEQREKINNPFGIDRRKPFNKLRSLDNWDFSALMDSINFGKLKDLEIMSRRLNEMNPSKEKITKLLAEEFKYSNFIEGIHNDNDRLFDAWEKLGENELNKREFLVSAKNLSPDGSKIRTRAVCLASNGHIHHTPPSGNRRLHHMINKLFDYRNDDISTWVMPAIFHTQYELIHPLSDGNGRTGRLIMLKQVMEMNKLKYPLLISKEIYYSKSIYYKELNTPMFHNEWNSTIEYFLDVFENSMMETLKFLDD